MKVELSMDEFMGAMNSNEVFKSLIGKRKLTKFDLGGYPINRVVMEFEAPYEPIKEPVSPAPALPPQ